MHTVVMGAGRSGLAAARFLALQGHPVVLTDRRPGPDADLEIDLAKRGIPGVWGDHPFVLLEDCDELVISPGVPRNAPFVAEASSRGIRIVGEVELAHRAIRERKDGSRILAVTGTNGKSTTTDLVAHLLKSSGIPAIACGNLGTPMIEAVQAAPASMVFAVELSSYQLESIQAFHAEGAAFLNLTPDHLARHGTMETYLDTKLRIFERQTSADLRVVPPPIPSGGRMPPEADGRPGSDGWNARPGAMAKVLRLYGEALLGRAELQSRRPQRGERPRRKSPGAACRGFQPGDP